jgi:4-hydroxybenzoate polyprenyltransferase
VAAPSPAALFVAFTTSLLFFLQLRIADEFKDFDEDARFRPYRPVPRGLVTLRELACVGVAAGLVQLGLALWLHASLVWLLVPSWVYLALMTREFFVPRWLRAHPLIYMASHMLILPLVDLYATACDWRVAGERDAPDGLYWFLVVSYLNGVVIEIGRKTRAPADEEHGVETYSALWGAQGAARAWLFAVLLTGAAAWEASVRIGTEAPTLAMLVLLVMACGAVARRFVQNARKGSGKSLEVMAGVWTLLMYLSLGAAPLAFTLWREAR